MKTKRLLCFILAIVLILPTGVLVFADGDTYVDIDNVENMDIQSDETDVQATWNFVDGKDIIINSDKVYVDSNDAPIYASVLSNFNTELSKKYPEMAKYTYIPKIEEVPWIKSEIMESQNLTTLYTGFYNNTASSSAPNAYSDEVSVGESRALFVLGSDIMIDTEKFNFNTKVGVVSKDLITGQDGTFSKYTDPRTNPVSTTYEVTLLPERDLNRIQSIQALYKAFGIYCYEARTEYEPFSAVLPNSRVPIEHTPFMESINGVGVFVDTTRYYAQTFISRTSPLRYWDRAVESGIINATNATSSSITTKEFLTYVHKLSDITGEPVITDKESNMLLAAYGYKLPPGLSPAEFQAVQYLMVRGIIDESINLDSNLDRDTMLTILMRVKDKNSRATFKEIDIPYNEQLVSGGYYPVDATLSESTIINPTVTLNNPAGSTVYYDYFIKKQPETTFRRSQGTENTDLFISQGIGNSWKDSDGSIFHKEIAKANYLGIEGDYYHFKIASDFSTYYQDNNYLINSSHWKDSPGLLMLPKGGGYYEFDDKVKSPNTPSIAYPSAGESVVTLKKTRGFSLQEQSEYASEPIQNEIIMASSERLKLAGESATVDISFITKDPKLLTWAEVGTTPTALQANHTYVPADVNKSVITEIVTNTSGAPSGYHNVVVKFKQSEIDARELFSKYMKVAAKATDKSFPMYLNTSSKESPMLSLNGLNQYLGTDSKYTVLKHSNGNYTIRGPQCHAYIDTKNNIIVNNQVVTKQASDDNNWIIEVDGGKDYLIDYRIMTGAYGKFLVISDNSGKKELSFNQVVGAQSASSMDYLDDRQMYPITHSTMNTGIKIPVVRESNFREGTASYFMSLEAANPLAPYIVYRDYSNGNSIEYLLLFVNKDSVPPSVYKTREARKSFLSLNIGIELPDDLDCFIYTLSTDQNEVQVGINKSVIKPSRSDISWHSRLGYALNLPVASSEDGVKFDYNIHLNFDADKSQKYTLPYVWYEGANGGNPRSVNINVSNTFEATSFSANGSQLKKRPATSSINAGQTGKLPNQPIAMYRFFYSLETSPIKVGDIINTSNSLLAIDGIIGKVTSNVQAAPTSSTVIPIVMETSSSWVNLSGISRDTELIELPTTGTKKIFALNNVELAQGISSTEDSKWRDWLNNVGSGIMNTFGWGEYSLIEQLKAAEDIISIISIVMLSIIPRLFLFLFLSLATISLVSKYPFVIKLCESTIDPVKILSLGMLNIHTIDAKKIWISTFFACALLGMLQGGVILDVVNWIMRGAQGILGR